MGPIGSVSDPGLRVVVLGVGNTLLGDEGVGVRVIEHLQARGGLPETMELLDGGTLGLALLPRLEDVDVLVICDAALMDAPPGTVRVFQGEEMDGLLRHRVRTPHDIGLDDLLDALRLRERLPPRRVLVAIQPHGLALSGALSPSVAAAVPDAAQAVKDCLSLP